MRTIIICLLTALSGCKSLPSKTSSTQALITHSLPQPVDGTVRVITNNKSILSGTLVKGKTGYYLLSAKHGFSTFDQAIQLRQLSKTIQANLSINIYHTNSDIFISKLEFTNVSDVDAIGFQSIPAKVFARSRANSSLQINQEVYCSSTVVIDGGLIQPISETRHIVATPKKYFFVQEELAPGKSGGVCVTKDGLPIGIAKGNTLPNGDKFVIGVLERLKPNLNSIISVL